MLLPGDERRLRQDESGQSGRQFTSDRHMVRPKQ